MRFGRRFLAIAILALLPWAALSAQSGQQLFQQALSMEQANGRFEEAIQLYQRVIKEAGSDRALAARALLQIGRCHERLGQSSARTAYEQVIKDYADQADIVALARTQLTGLARRDGATVGVITRPLVNDTGNNSGFRLVSPDGTKVALYDFTRGQNLSVFDSTTKTTSLITSLDWTNEWAGAPVWSTDSRRIAYTQAPWKPDAGVMELRIAALDGKSQSVFKNTANPEGPVETVGWTPDGRMLLVVVNTRDNTHEMGFVAIASGTFTALRSFPSDASPGPRLSPDGRFIAYADGPVSLGDIHVISADGRVDRLVVNQPGDDRQPLWSPDGRHLAFTRNRNGASTLDAVAIKDGDAVGEPFKIKEGMQAAQLIDWTTRGVAYYTRERTSDIYTVATDPATLQPSGAALQLPYARNGLNFRATWSPDGKQLAFIASDPAPLLNRRYVVVSPAAGGEVREFLIPNGSYQWPDEPYDLRWFGDSRGLGFSGFGVDGHVAFRLTLATGEWKTDPVPTSMWTRLEWSDDGSSYFYARHGTGGEDPTIIERSFQSQRERVVYHVQAKDVAIRGLTLGPDRRSLAFTLGSSCVVVDTVTGDASTVVKADPANPMAAPPAFHGWAPDGRSLVLGLTRGGKSVLVLAPVRGGEERLVAFDQSRLGFPASGTPRTDASGLTLRWSPDGRRVAIVRASERVAYFMIENPLVAAIPLTTSR